MKKHYWFYLQQNNNIYLSSRNLKKAKVITADQLNTYDVLNCW